MAIPTVDDVESGQETPTSKRKAQRNFGEDATKFWRKLGCAIYKAEYKYRDPSGAWHTKDAFGFGDYLVVGPPIRGTLYLQVTSRAQARNRLKKVASIKEAVTVLQSGNLICVQSFDENNESKLEFVGRDASDEQFFSYEVGVNHKAEFSLIGDNKPL